MSKILILIMAALLSCMHCHPVDTASQAASSSALHLTVHNSTQSVNYKLAPIMTELEDVDEEISKELDTILPYIHFFFDSLFGHPHEDESTCADDMVVQLVHDHPEIEHDILQEDTEV